MNKQQEKDLYKKLRKEGLKPRWIPREIDRIKAEEGKPINVPAIKKVRKGLFRKK